MHSMLDPHAAKKATAQQASDLRNRLYRQGQLIELELVHAERTYQQAPTSSHRDAYLIALGRLDGFIKTRTALRPTIHDDRALGQQRARVASAYRALKQSEEPVKSTD